MYHPVEASSGINLGPFDLSSDVPLVEASSGQDWYYIREA